MLREKETGEQARCKKGNGIFTHHSESRAQTENIDPLVPAGPYVKENGIGHRGPEEYIEEVGMEQEEQSHVTIQHEGQPGQQECEYFSAQQYDYSSHQYECEGAEQGRP